MYAVIETGGKQYTVKPGQPIKVEKLDKAVGEWVEFPVLLSSLGIDSLKVGSPYVADMKVKAQVVSHGRDKKIKIIKFRRRKHHYKQQGHRQYYTALNIIDIVEDHAHGS